MFIHMNKVINGNDKWQWHTDCHLAIVLGEQMFLANFGLVLLVMLGLKVLTEFILISGVIDKTNRTH